ncbi:hypothetical protein LCGC14_0965440, partial [marine sediment metagenome]
WEIPGVQISMEQLKDIPAIVPVEADTLFQ